VANPGAVPAPAILNDSPNWAALTEAGTYQASAWIRSDFPGIKVTIELREYCNGTEVGEAETTLAVTTTWQQISVAYSPAQHGQTTLDLQILDDTVPPGESFRVDTVSLTRS